MIGVNVTHPFGAVVRATCPVDLPGLVKLMNG